MTDRKRQLTFTGSHLAIGKQVGEAYKAWGKRRLYLSPIDIEIYEEQLTLYKKFFPRYLEWLQGVALGSGFNEEDVVRTYLTEFLYLDDRPPTTCSVFGLRREDRVFVGRNYDWREAAEKSTHHLSVNFTDKSAYSFTALSDMGVWKVGAEAYSPDYTILLEDAWNEWGLFVCQNGAPGKPQNLGMSSLHIIQIVAEQCRTIEEAIMLIMAIPCNEPKIFTVVDKTGDMAVIEKPTEFRAQVRRSDNQVVATNHYQSDSLKQYNAEIFKDVPFHSTFARYAYLETFLKTLNTVSIETLKLGLLKPPVLQDWRGVDEGDYLTAWIEVLELSNLESDINIAPLLRKL